MIKTFSSCALLACTLQACALDPEPEVTASQEPLLQSPSGATLGATVNIYFMTPYNGYSVVDGSCTATVLTDHWLLTAAHCFDDPAATDTIEVAVAGTNGVIVASRAYVGRFARYRHPNFGGLVPISYDFGLVQLLDGPIAFSNRAALYADTAHPWYGSYTMSFWEEGFGYGSDPGGASACSSSLRSDILRRTQQSPDGSSSTLAITDAEPACPGDSGGPWMFSLYDTKWRMIQFGVFHGTSWGGYVGGSTLANYQVAAAVPSGLPWIEQTMRNALGPSVSLLVTNGTATGYAYRTYRERPNVALTEYVYGAGTVTNSAGGSCSGPSCTAYFAPNTSVTLLATPDTGSTFQGWTNCPSAAQNICTATLTTSMSITARFSASTCYVDSVCKNACVQECIGQTGCLAACTADCTVCN